MEQKADGAEMIAIVSSIFPSKGYGVAYLKSDHPELSRDTSITFSLRLWPKGKPAARKGQKVIIRGVTEYAQGWRAEAIEPKTVGFDTSPSMEQR